MELTVLAVPADAARGTNSIGRGTGSPGCSG